MKPRLVIGHVSFDLAKLPGLYPFLLLVPGRIENETVGVQVRVGQVAFDRPGRLVNEVRPDQLPG
ncbi:hypothetical protein D3C87_1864990 [compost metagenome]